MPNTEVKLTNAESTWPEAAREDRKLLIKEKTLTNVGVFFHMPGLPICMHKFEESRIKVSGRIPGDVIRVIDSSLRVTILFPVFSARHSCVRSE